MTSQCFRESGLPVLGSNPCFLTHMVTSGLLELGSLCHKRTLFPTSQGTGEKATGLPVSPTQKRLLVTMSAATVLKSLKAQKVKNGQFTYANHTEPHKGFGGTNI